MTTPNIWSKVAVAVQSALGTAKTITAISKANPAAVSSTAHGFNDGDVVLLKISGMTQLDYRVVRVTGKTTDAFNCEGVNSTSYDTFTSGTAEKITFGTSCATLQDISSSGGEAAAIPVQTIHDEQNYELSGNRSPMAYNFGSIWDPADAGLTALASFDNLKTACAISFTFSSGAKIYFAAFPSCNLNPGGSAGALVTTPVALRLRGRLTAYSS